MAKQEVPITHEEQLDRLIERWECGSWLRSVASDEIEACLAAAETIMHQQAIAVSSAFAARLEILLRTYARSLVAQQNKVIAFPYSQLQIRIRQRTENKH